MVDLLKSFYYFWSRLFKGRRIQGKAHARFHFHGTILHGECIHLGEDFTVSEGYVLACYPPQLKKGQNDNRAVEPEINIGPRFFANRFLRMYCACRIEIGADCLIGSDVLITDNDHGINLNLTGVPYREQPLTSSPVTIGKNVWIGEKVCILKGVKIGDNCVIGAGSVVTKSIPANCVAVGNPAKVIKRFSQETGSWMPLAPGENT